MAVFALLSYFTLVFFVGFFSLKKQISSKDFIIGSRSLNFWLTALAAHASDMSSWLFLAYPAAIFTVGTSQIFTALGLVVFMWLNWQLVAKKLRIATERLQSQTLSTYFEKSLGDFSGKIRLFTGCLSLIFYAIYISAGVYGIGLLSEALFNIPYSWGCLLGVCVIVPYVFFGGYITLAWIDLFQGLFLLAVICFVPIYYFKTTPHLSIDLTINLKQSSWLVLFLGWGLGYFGQPHIITKFMGIKDPEEIKRSKYVGMSWMFISLLAATFVGLIGRSIYAQNLQDPQTLFLNLVKDAFNPFTAYFMLCAVIAATINATSSQMLVLASSLTEDIYHRFINKTATSSALLRVSRLTIIVVAALSFCLAYFKIGTIYNLVLYAWSGLGSTFGPLVLYCLYKKNPSLKAAWACLIAGSLTSLSWPMISSITGLISEPLIPSFTIAFVAAFFFKQIKKSV